MRGEISDGVVVVYSDSGVTRRVRGVQVVDNDPVFLTLLRADGTMIRFNKSVVQKVEEVGR